MGALLSLDTRLWKKGYGTSEVHGTGELLAVTNGLVETHLDTNYELKVFIKEWTEDKSMFVECKLEPQIVYHNLNPNALCKSPVTIFLSKRNGEMYARLCNAPKMKKLRLRKSVRLGWLHLKLVVVFSPQHELAVAAPSSVAAMCGDPAFIKTACVNDVHQV
jgi:hypothetical protein